MATNRETRQMNKEVLREQVEKLKWFHTIDFGHGIITQGVDDSPGKMKTLDLPRDLRGMTVLDIGAWDGFFSFETERRGASRILATDYFCWNGPGWGTKDGFELARRVFHSKVEDMDIDVMDISPEKVGMFDLVLFLGILYHMQHPLLALEKLFSVTQGQAIVETHVDLLDCEWPAMRYYPETELNGDGSNWWGPNPGAVEAMLKTVGFRAVKPVYLRRFQDTQQGRFVVHAWR